MNEGPGIGFIYNKSKDFRAGMVDYIRHHFSELLGDDVALLDQPGGLEAIRAKYHP